MKISDLKIGDFLLFGGLDVPILWFKASDDHDFIAVNTCGSSRFDLPEPSAPNGNNFYPISNIAAALNLRPGENLRPAHAEDIVPPYNQFASVLCKMDEQELKNIVDRSIEYDVPERLVPELGEKITYSAKVFLPSVQELGYGDNGNAEVQSIINRYFSCSRLFARDPFGKQYIRVIDTVEQNITYAHPKRLRTVAPMIRLNPDMEVEFFESENAYVMKPQFNEDLHKLLFGEGA